MGIDLEAKKIVDEQYARCKTLLLEKQDIVEALANRLFEKETLVYADLVAVMGPRPIPLKPEYAKFVTATSSMETTGKAEVQSQSEIKTEKPETKSDGKTSST